jgi:hypothetical protein
MNYIIKIVVVGLCSGSFLTSAFASNADLAVATLSDASGKVLINQGEGFSPIEIDMSLKAGDKIFIGEKSLATLSYANCAVLLDKPAVITVKADGACNSANSVSPAADVYLPPPVVGLAGIPPAVILTTVGITAVACTVACKSIFGNESRTISGR